jgi:hypothetical protein
LARREEFTRLSSLAGVSDSDFLRIGTIERDEALKLLGEHFSDGRLPVDEYDQRVAKAVAAETRADVKPLFADLPPPHPMFMLPPSAIAAPAPPPAQVLSRQVAPYMGPERYTLAGGLLQLFFPFGIGRFYLGDTKRAITQLALVPLGVGVIWCLIDAIVLMVQSLNNPIHRRDPGPT